MLSTGPSGAHRTVRCSPDLNLGSIAKRVDTGLRTPGAPTYVRCLTLAEPDSLHTGRTGTASGASGLASGECFSARKHSRDFSKFPTGAIENMHFIFSVGGREEPILSLPFNLHLLLKMCQHHKVCKPTCVRVLAFSQTFSSKELS